jgi:response regulator RpfG family c-di-GMP phosphodiesterase
MGVILIAFERDSEQSALEQLLSSRGHRVVRSANGLAALDAARRDPPQAIVSDIVLPRMDGFALCRKWKQDERLQSIPFLFYTRRHDDPKYERFALELGAERFLPRSVPAEALLAALDEIMPANGAAVAAAVSAARASDEGAAQQAATIALEKAQYAQAQAQAQLQSQAQAHAQALQKAQQAQAQAQEKAEQVQAQLQAQAQAHVQALERAQQGHALLRSQLSELEATSKRLAGGEARFRRVFEANPLPMWIADHATGGFIAVNDVALTLYGYGRAEFLALKAAALEADTAQAGSALRTHLRKDGATLTVSVASREIEFDGRKADLVCAFDFTERLAAERAKEEKAAVASRQAGFLVELFKQAETLDEAAIVRRLLDEALDTVASPLAFLYFVDPLAKTITLAAWRELGSPPASLPNAEAQPLARAGLFAQCVRTRNAISSNDPAAKPQHDGLPDLQRYLAVPMLCDGETVAVLGVANREAGYDEQDQQQLAALADGVWRVLNARRTHAKTLRSLQRTDVALHGMIDSFVRMLERHDPYTAGSSRRLAALAVAIGREAGLDGERQHALRIAALLHDIGNIAVPASILSKPAPLTETEQALMRTHVEEGCQLLAEIDFGAPIADIVYQSHERVDGSGYPRGLKGEEILLEARILAIADTVEAMCSPRSYRPAAGMDAAIDEINRGAGTLYDLQLVTACTRLIRQHGFALPE